MPDEDDREPRASRSWWIDAIDPVGNIRALADAQTFGRRAAEELADRVLNEQRSRGPGDDGPPDDLDQALRRLRADVVRAGELSIGIFDDLARLLGSVAHGRSGTARPERKPAEVVLPGAAAGAETNGLFWIHNTSAVPVPAVRPHALPLRSHSGDELPAGAVRFDPAILAPLPARSSCGIDVRVSLPPDTRPGTYVSIILVENVAEMHLPLRVTVQATEPGP
jgi:hypothetical protein